MGALSIRAMEAGIDEIYTGHYTGNKVYHETIYINFKLD